MTADSSFTLAELGEREIISQMIEPLISRNRGNTINDDCATISLDGVDLLISSDRAPRKTYMELMKVGDWADLAHFHVTSNISDIAAMGGKPLGILLSLAFNRNTLITDLQLYLSGIAEALKEYDIELWGGDTKESRSQNTVITVLGSPLESGALSRYGANEGDLIFMIGEPCGTALSEYIAASRLDAGGPGVYRPRAQVAAGLELSKRSLVTACMDVSDGLFAAAEQLASINRLCAFLDLTGIKFAPSPQSSNETRWRNLVLNTGGEFSLLVTAKKENAKELTSLGAWVVGQMEKENNGRLSVKGPGSDSISLQPWEQFRTVESTLHEIIYFT